MVTETECAKRFLEIVPKAMRIIKSEMRKAAEADLTVPQFRLFARLARSSATSKELADWMGVAPPTVSRMVEALMRRKLIRRGPRSHDKRQIPLELTKQGRASYERIRGKVHKSVVQKISTLNEIQKKDLNAGLSVLQKLVI